MNVPFLGRLPLGILSPEERLAYLEKIRQLPKVGKRRKLPIKDDPNLRLVYGGDVFTDLLIEIDESKAEEHIYISFEFLRNGRPLPRGFSCDLEKDGTPFTILETFNKSTSEGTGVFCGYKGPYANADDAKQATQMLSRFDKLLELAAGSPGNKINPAQPGR